MAGDVEIITVDRGGTQCDAIVMTLANTKKNPDLRRVDAKMSPMEALQAVSGGIVGNIPWLMDLAANHQPPSNMAGMTVGHFIGIDDMGVYDESLWVLFKRVVGMDIGAFAALSNALQARMVTAAEIRDVVRAHEKGLPATAEDLGEALLSKAGITVRTEEERRATQAEAAASQQA